MDLKTAMTEWTEALCLKGWHIEACILSPTEYKAKQYNCDTESIGHNDIDFLRRTSKIQLLDGEPDMEFSLVHELVHILVADYANYYDYTLNSIEVKSARDAYKGVERHELEKTVNNITYALLGTRRMAQEVRI